MVETWARVEDAKVTQGDSDAAKHLRDAILKQKARIVEIERTLNRPLSTEHRGRPTHGGEGWRLRLEEEKQHLMVALQESEAELVRTSSSPSVQTVESKSTNVAAGNTREAFLRPILDKNGFSVHGWATEANVDFHTANDYLKGKTKPYPDTLKKLANALGIEVATLPE